MSDRRHDAATATVGLAGVGASGALRHSGLDSAYDGGERPRFFQERKFLTRAKVPGRKRYATAMALGLFSVPPAAVGSSRLVRRESASKRDDKRSFLGEGLAGARESFHERNQTVKERPPARLVAGNYAAGAAIGSAAGGLTHMGLGRTKVPGTARAAAASAAGILAGSATLPLQSKLTQRASHGKYEVTPTGVRRKRAKARPASSGAHVVEARPGRTTMSGHQLRQELVGKYDPGASMSRGERRARVTASGVPIPIVGDVAQAATAARLSPEKYRHRSAVQNFAGGQAGSLIGNVAGAAGALALARKSPGFERRALKTGQQIERVKGAARSRVGLKPVGAETSRLENVLTHPKTPRAVTRTAARALDSRAGQAVAANPGVAAVGAFGGGMIGGQTGQQMTYNHIMTRDDRYRRQQNQSGRAGSRLAKRDDNVTGMSRADEMRQIKRKRRAAAVSALTSTGSIAALGALSAAPLTHGKLRGRLITAGTTGGTVSGGLAAINGLEGAHLQRRDLKAREQALLSKGVRVPGVRRAGVKRGYLRQVRTNTGLHSTYVRGGIFKAGPNKKFLLLTTGNGMARMSGAARRHPRRRGMWEQLERSRQANRMTVPAEDGVEMAPSALYDRQRGIWVSKLDTTMSERRAHELARQYDTRGTLPKDLSRDQRMAAYEARYIASGGKKNEKWKRRADRAEVGRNVGLAGATLAGAAVLGHKAPGLRRLNRHHLESAGLASGVFGGASELYGEHARSRRASYQNSPAGVAASALQRMRAYTPGGN